MSEIKIDLEILEKLWNGDLFPAEQCHPQDKEYRELLLALDTVHAQLLKIISENSEIEKLLEDYEQQVSMIEERNQLKAFKMGFALALSMMVESLMEKV